MGLFSKFKKKDDFSFSNPPDFSQPPGKDPFASDPYAKDPLAGDPFGAGYGQDPFGDQSSRFGQESNFSHDIFTSNEPTNADRARSYAQGLSAQHGPGRGMQPNTAGQSYAGTVTGHEAQLILERLDTIKAELDAIRQRMLRIEHYIEQSDQKTATQRRYF